MPDVPPTLYLSDRVNGWWPGIDTRCAACLPSPNGRRPQLRLDEPEGKYPGSLVCMGCGREPYIVKESREVGYTHINWGHHDAPAQKQPCTVPDCGKPSRRDGALCPSHHVARTRERVMAEGRTCERCDDPVYVGQSLRHCRSHMLELRAQGR